MGSTFFGIVVVSTIEGIMAMEAPCLRPGLRNACGVPHFPQPSTTAAGNAFSLSPGLHEQSKMAEQSNDAPRP